MSSIRIKFIFKCDLLGEGNTKGKWLLRIFGSHSFIHSGVTSVLVGLMRSSDGGVCQRNQLWRLVRKDYWNEHLLPTSWMQVRLRHALIFKDEETSSAYKDQLHTFTSTSKRDIYQRVEQSMSLGPYYDHDERFLAFKPGQSSFVSRFISGYWFWIATFMGLTVPYRVYVERRYTSCCI